MAVQAIMQTRTEPLSAPRHGTEAAALAPLLSRLGLSPDPETWQRLGGGRSNMSWRVAGPGGDHVVKLYRPETASAVFPNDPHAEARALKALHGTGLAPELLFQADSPLGPCVVYRHLSGSAGAPDPAEAGRLLRHLHAMPAPPGLRIGPDGSQALRAEIRQQAKGLRSRDGRALGDLLLEGIAVPDLTASGEVALIHGDPVPGNMVATPSGLCLIDWQCPAAGDPAVDIATFLSPGMNLIYRGRTLTLSERLAFLEAYGSTRARSRFAVLEPLFHARMATYCLSRAAAGSALDRDAALLELQALARKSGTAPIEV
ncbi:phosphotransferase family protein [Pseudooceanicola sp. HF7]|uniref:phosphotransferase family protein n=1 Tax=Pseudooceanicola sp. HF7 TaxID=2721560 RepID=UPI0014305F7D|nr:aminoglycoside phosphotransferase family protein [Pseudooceanicola sp. HF7]NIZ09744.1 aminoglycoside phosphotransferase family protein [Pseudooceanicola sp. HF7]